MAVLASASRAVTVTVNGGPAVAVAGAEMLKWVAGPAETVIGPAETVIGRRPGGRRGHRVGGGDGLAAGGDQGDARAEGVHAVVAGHDGVTGRHAGRNVRAGEAHGAEVAGGGVGVGVESGDGDGERGPAVAVAGAEMLKWVAGPAETVKGLESAAVRAPSVARNS